MKKAEIFFASLSVIALIMNIFLIPFGGFLTVLALSTLSMIYFYLSFALFNDIRFRMILKKDSYKELSTSKIIGLIIAGLTLSIITLGLLFKFQSWPFATFYLRTGLGGLLIVTIVGLIKFSKHKSPFYKRIFIRSAIIGGLGLILFLLPYSSVVDFKYRNHPGYADALRNAIAQPENRELWEKVEAEHQKMESERLERK